MEGTLTKRLAENGPHAELHSQRKRRTRSQGQLGAPATATGPESHQGAKARNRGGLWQLECCKLAGFLLPRT